MSNGLPVYIDIDGTLTLDPERRWGTPVMNRIEHVRALIAGGTEVVLWSGGGTEYARQFAAKYGLKAVGIGKPAKLIDDNPTIRPLGRIKIVTPRDFFAA